MAYVLLLEELLPKKQFSFFHSAGNCLIFSVSYSPLTCIYKAYHLLHGVGRSFPSGQIILACLLRRELLHLARKRSVATVRDTIPGPSDHLV